MADGAPGNYVKKAKEKENVEMKQRENRITTKWYESE
jgi:hypothetical protein